MSDSHREYVITRRGSMPVITKDMILDPQADLDDVLDFADELNVNMAGLNTMEEMQCRLCMHLDFLEMKGNVVEKILKLMAEKTSDDTERRKKLKELLNKFMETNKSCHRLLSDSGKERIQEQTTLESLLQTEGITENLRKDLTRKIEQISIGECVVVVAGETNAGKSTFLNLLLKTSNLLTVKAIPSTSVITRVSYGESIGVQILYESGKKEDVNLDSNKPLAKQLENWLVQRDLEIREMADDTADKIAEVNLKIPSDILKSGLVLVDSPGIGENPVMDGVIQRFVANNRIDGFIYLIKSDSGARVDEDRIGELLKIILTSQKKSQRGFGFDPRLAIFVCNHWDSVNSAEREEVYEYIVKRLEKYWPGLNPDQVIRFSAMDTRRELDLNVNYITPDYKAVWEGIHELFTCALDKRVTSTYKWMETVLKRMTQHLKTFVHRLDNSEEDLQKTLSKIEMKLERITSRSEEVLTRLSNHIDKACEDIYKSFREHLMTPSSKIAITMWTQTETPAPEDFTDWTMLKMEIYERTSNRISKELVKWEESQGHIQEIEKTILTEINQELCLFTEELSKVDDELNADTASTTSNESELPQNKFGTLKKRMSVGNYGRKNLPGMLVYSEDHLSVPLIAQILSPLGNAMQNLVGRAKKGRVSDYEKNRTKVSHEKSERYYEYILNTGVGNDFLRKFVNALLEQTREKLSEIRDKIPAVINADRKVMEHIVRCRRDTKVSIELYEEMMNGLEDLKQQLTEYGEGEIFVDDFKNADIQISDSLKGSARQSIRISNFIENSNENNVSQTGETRALWTILQNGTVRKEDEETERPVFIRIYMTSSGVANITSEVAKLRFLKHNNVAEFLGLHRAHIGFPALIYNNKMRTLRQFLKIRGRDGKERVRIFQETVKGLEYLHRRRLVHMELNTHTVTIEQGTETVKLTGSCLPRKSNLPMDREAVQVSHFVFISPEVLNGEAYVSCDDAYAVGLLALELVFRKKPYKEYRTWSLDQFAREVQPRQMLRLDEVLGGQPEELSSLIMRSFGKADNRPHMHEFLNVKLPMIERMQTVEEETPIPTQRFHSMGLPSRI
ncbi:uncharacterized protein LOC111108748 [Crassostrea virginica]